MRVLTLVIVQGGAIFLGLGNHLKTLFDSTFTRVAFCRARWGAIRRRYMVHLLTQAKWAGDLKPQGNYLDASQKLLSAINLLHEARQLVGEDIPSQEWWQETIARLRHLKRDAELVHDSYTAFKEIHEKGWGEE